MRTTLARRKQTETTIRQLAEDPTSGGDRIAACVLGYWDAPEHVQLLLRVAEDATRSREVRDEAIRALGRLEAPEALDVLIRTLLDPNADDTTRWKCADALGAIGDHGALEALASVAETTSDKTLRQSARDAIDSIKNDTEG